MVKNNHIEVSFPTHPSSPFADRFDLDAARAMIAHLLEADPAEIANDPAYSLFVEYEKRVRMLEERSRPGVDMLHPSSRDCIEAARVLYCGIVDEVERQDYEVFTSRATVPMRRRLAVAGPAWVRAVRARRRYGDGTAA